MEVPLFDREQEAVRKFEALLPLGSIPGDRTACEVRVGGVEEEVVDDAQETRADLIVLNAPGGHHRLLRSTCETIVRDAPAPSSSCDDPVRVGPEAQHRSEHGWAKKLGRTEVCYRR